MIHVQAMKRRKRNLGVGQMDGFVASKRTMKRFLQQFAPQIARGRNQNPITHLKSEEAPVGFPGTGSGERRLRRHQTETTTGWKPSFRPVRRPQWRGVFPVSFSICSRSQRTVGPGWGLMWAGPDCYKLKKINTFDFWSSSAQLA